MDSSGEASGLSTPTDRENLRKSQYKSGGSSSTPEWRISYRKRCKDRLTQSRERLISRFRNIKTGPEDSPSPTQEGALCGTSEGGVNLDTEDPVRVVTLSVKEVMKEEWEQMRVDNSELPRISHRKRRVPFVDTMEMGGPRWKPSCTSSLYTDDEFESEDINSVLTVIDELTQELILEEQAMLAQYQEMQTEMDLRLLEENSLCATVGSLSAGSNVICPICQKKDDVHYESCPCICRNFLFQNVRNIYCACGMQIDTIHDGLTLDHLQEQLELCVTQHRYPITNL